MNKDFFSAFADRLSGYLYQKRSLGFSFSNISNLRTFDRMCAEQFPSETKLTVDICNAWASRRENESAKTMSRRVPFIREFARYLICNGEQAFILPPINIKWQRHIPHIYSHAELTEMWQAFDNIQPTKTYPVANIVTPVLFRLLYCCGLRPSEAINLRVEDVNLQLGKLFIAESKGHKDRIVMLSDDVRELCSNYDETITKHFPHRKFFFAKDTTNACNYDWIGWIFRGVRKNMHIESMKDTPPRLYDLRHTFATHRLYQWMREGKDINAMMPYLSAYMGHSHINETFYYVQLVPGMFETMSGFKYKSVSDIFPEVMDYDE